MSVADRCGVLALSRDKRFFLFPAALSSAVEVVAAEFKEVM